LKRLITIFICVSFWIKAVSQTVLFFAGTVTAPVSPTVNAAWNVTTGNTYKMMYPSKTTYCLVAAGSTPTSGASGAASPRQILIQTYMTQPLQAQTVNSGATFYLQMRFNLSTTAGVAGQAKIFLRTCDESGLNITDVGNAVSTNLPSSPAANRTITVTLGSNLTITDRQRIIIEIGWNYSSGSSTTLTGTLATVLSPTLGNLPVDNTTTTSLNPIFTCSQTLLFDQNIGLNL
jgi:hypothetical protein